MGHFNHHKEPTVHIKFQVKKQLNSQKKRMHFIYLAFNIKVNLSQLIKMLNGKKMIIGTYSNIRM